MQMFKNDVYVDYTETLKKKCLGGKTKVFPL